MASAGDKLDFSSKEYAWVLLENLQDIHNTRTFCDIKVDVNGCLFEAHRVILSAASNFFRAMFTGGLSESDKDVVHIGGVDEKIFESLLGFIYSGALEVTSDNCQDILTAADMLGLAEVVEACCTFMRQQLHPSNCIGIYQFADAHSCSDLQKSAEKFIASNFLEVVSEEEFSTVSKEMLILFLFSEDLHIDQEYQVFNAAMKWIASDFINRRKNIFEVLAPVRFPLIAHHQLEKYIELCPDLSVKIALRKLVQDFKFDNRLPYNLKMSRFKPSLFRPRRSATKNIYLIGGYSREEGGRWSDSQSLGTVECFNTYDEQWKCIPPLQYSRSGHGVALLNGVVYVIGGESDSLIFDNVECLEPTTSKWVMLANLTVPRCGLGAAVVEEKIYVLGGWVGSEIGRTIERFDPQIGVWTVTDMMPNPKFAMGAIEYEGLIYVIGGMSDDGAERASVENYNPVTKEWVSLPPMHEKRAYVGVAILNRCMYAVGGWNETCGALSTVEKYSFGDNTWSQVTSLTVARAGAAVASVNGLLYVMGGRTCRNQFAAPSTLKIVECYDPQTDTWLSLGSMPNSCCEAAAIVL